MTDHPHPTLEDRLRDRGPLSPQEAVDLLATLAEVVQRVHEQGLVYGTLRPRVVLLPGSGLPAIESLARPPGGESDRQRFSPAEASYMAPEQAAGKEGEVTTATDVYALGAVLYAALSGHPPFEASNWLDVLIQVHTQPPTPLRQSRPYVPPALEAICLRCLDKEPAGRYVSAAELARALRHCPVQEPPCPRPGPLAEPLPLALPMGGLPPPLPRPVSPGGAGPGSIPIAHPVAHPVGPAAAIPLAMPVHPVPAAPPARASLPEVIPLEEPFAAELRGLRASPAGYQRRPQAEPRFPWMVVVFSLLLLGSTGFVSWLVLQESSPSVPERRGKPKRNTTHRVGPRGPHRTVGGALRSARSGDRIIVESDFVREYLWVDAHQARSLKDVRIEAANPRRKVTWAPPAGESKNTTLVLLNDVEGLVIKGFSFDGEGRLNNLIVLTGCAGVKLEDVELAHFTRSGIQFLNCGAHERQGEPIVRPVELSRVQVTSDEAPPLLFEVRKNIASPRANHVIVRDDCTFAGNAAARLIGLAGENAGVRLPAGLRTEMVPPRR